MISIICFEESLIIPKEEAENLNLSYKTNPQIGFRGEKLQLMASYDHYKEDCIEFEGKYYKNQEKLDKKDAESDYYLYTKYTGNVEYVHVEQDNHLVDLLLFATKCQYKFFITQSVKGDEPTINNINVILQTLEEKAEKVNSLVDKIKENTFNSKTNVHVGGGLITTYNDLLLKEDICTDALQSDLNNGWRIIAVCNQPDQRRPDYILGRYNPQLEVAEKPDAGR